jgi:hypothetical protein
MRGEGPEGLERVGVGGGLLGFLGVSFEWLFVSLLALGHRTKMHRKSRVSLNPQ